MLSAFHAWALHLHTHLRQWVLPHFTDEETDAREGPLSKMENNGTDWGLLQASNGFSLPRTTGTSLSPAQAKASRPGSPSSSGVAGTGLSLKWDGGRCSSTHRKLKVKC